MARLTTSADPYRTRSIDSLDHIDSALTHGLSDGPLALTERCPRFVTRASYLFCTVHMHAFVILKLQPTEEIVSQLLCSHLAVKQEIHMIKEQLSEEPLQGGETVNGPVAPYGQRTRVTPERLAFVIREQWKTFNQVCASFLKNYSTWTPTT